jgi:hypothetical protein
MKEVSGLGLWRDLINPFDLTKLMNGRPEEIGLIPSSNGV